MDEIGRIALYAAALLGLEIISTLPLWFALQSVIKREYSMRFNRIYFFIVFQIFIVLVTTLNVLIVYQLHESFSLPELLLVAIFVILVLAEGQLFFSGVRAYARRRQGKGDSHG